MSLQDAMAAARRQHGDDIVLGGKAHRERIFALPAAKRAAAVMKHLGLQHEDGAPAHPPQSAVEEARPIIGANRRAGAGMRAQACRCRPLDFI